jgi:SPP1 gp7 family putative phage head morphogenesis protein
MPTAEALLMIQSRRQQMAGRAKPKKKQPEWLWPTPVAVEYTRFLSKYVDLLAEQIQKNITDHLQTLLDQRNLTAPRVDDWADDVERGINQSRLGLMSAPLSLGPKISDFGDKTNLWNDKEWRKQLQASFGVDIFQREPWLREELNSWTKENIDLITSMTEDHIKQVGGIVQRGIRSGASIKNISKDIQDRTGVTKSKAKLIARDQVSKLNGELTQLRQTNLGVRKYIWWDSGDSRVRDTHKAHNGKTYSWDKPPAGTGHPGEDYQCRCWAEPIFDEVKEELGVAEAEATPIGPPMPSAPVIKSFGSKASAQSARSRAGLTGTAKIEFNPSTGKWELHIPPGGVKPVIPAPAVKPLPGPISFEGTIKYGEYGSKASAQSTISKKKLQGAKIQFNPSTNKWEVWTSTKISPVVPVAPIAPVTPIKPVVPAPPVPKPISPTGTQYTLKGSYDTSVEAQFARTSSKQYNAVIQFNPTTGKWDLLIPNPVTPVTPTGTQQYITKSYGSKASAQSIKSKGGYKNATVSFNSATGKWELKIPVNPSTTGKLIIPEATARTTPAISNIKVNSGKPKITTLYQGDATTTVDLAEAKATTHLSEEVMRKITDNARKIRSLNYEVAQLYDPKTGELLYEISQHSDDGVYWLKAPDLENMVVVHNHPGSASFSGQDLQFVFASNAKSQIVFSEEYTYIMERNTAHSTWHGPKGKFTPGNDLVDEWKAVRTAEQAKLDKEFFTGQINNKQYYHMETHRTANEMADRYNFTYMRRANTESVKDAHDKWRARKNIDPLPEKNEIIRKLKKEVNLTEGVEL